MNELVLGDSLEQLIDHRGKTPKKLGTDFVECGVPVASAVLVKDGRLDLDEARCVSEATFRRWMAIPTRRGDVLLTSEAPLGRVARVSSDDPLVLGQRLFGLRGRSGVLDSGYLYYALQTDRVQADLLGRSTGTTVFGIRQSALRQVRIPAPSFPDQRAIAQVLTALDDKIAANDRICGLVDGLLRSKFSHLADGRGSAELRRIARVNVEQTRPTAGQTLRYLDISAVGQGAYAFPSESSWDDAPGRARRVVKQGDTVWSTVRPNRRSHALILDKDSRLVASTGLAVLSPRPGRVAGVYEASRTEQFVAYLESVAEGSAYPAVRADRFGLAPIPELHDGEWDAFEAEALPLRRRSHAAIRESRVLAALRDQLLPPLMSGKLRVRDAAKVVEGVA